MVYMEKFLENPRHIEIQVLADELQERGLPGRARLLDAAPPPEDHRGSAGAGHRPPRCADAHRRALRRGLPQDRLPRRRHLRVPLRERRVLLHRDEHARAGRASGHRDDHRHRHRAGADPHRRRREAARSASATSSSRAMPSSAASTPKTRSSSRPRPGSITSYHPPGGPGIRVDSHVYQGYTVPPHYDSMIGKVIAYGDTRDQAIRRMRIALSEMVVEGIKTNIPLHQELLLDDSFIKGGTSIHYLEEKLAQATKLASEVKPRRHGLALRARRCRTDAAHAEALSDALLDAGALSVDVEDAARRHRRRDAAVRRARQPSPARCGRCRASSACSPATPTPVAALAAAAARRRARPPPPHERFDGRRRGLGARDAGAVRADPRSPTACGSCRPGTAAPDPARSISCSIPAWPSAPAPSDHAAVPGWLRRDAAPAARRCSITAAVRVSSPSPRRELGAGAWRGRRRPAGAHRERAPTPRATASSARFDACALTRLDGAGGRYDLVVANILANPLRLLAPALARARAAGRRIALSGILAAQADDVAAAYAPWFRIGVWDRDEDWVALAGVRNTDPAG